MPPVSQSHGPQVKMAKPECQISVGEKEGCCDCYLLCIVGIINWDGFVFVQADFEHQVKLERQRNADLVRQNEQVTQAQVIRNAAAFKLPASDFCQRLTKPCEMQSHMFVPMHGISSKW